MPPGRRTSRGRVQAKPGKVSPKARNPDRRLRKILTSVDLADETTTRRKELDSVLSGFFRPDSEGGEATLGLADFLRFLFSNERDLVKEAFKVAKQVESIWPDHFEDSLVIALNELEYLLVRDFSEQEDWKHFVFVAATSVEIWGSQYEEGKILIFDILSKWINQMRKPTLAAVDPTGSFDQLLYSACTQLLLSHCGSTILAMNPTVFVILCDMMYQRVLSDDIPRLAKTNYLDTLLEMHALARADSGKKSAGAAKMPVKVEKSVVCPDSLENSLKCDLALAAFKGQESCASLKKDLAMTVDKQAAKQEPARVVMKRDQVEMEEESRNLTSSAEEPQLGDSSDSSFQRILDELKVEKEQSAERLSEATSPRTVIPRANVNPPKLEDLGKSEEKVVVVARLRPFLHPQTPFLVTNKESLVLGRSHDRCNVFIQDPKASRVHAEIRATDGLLSLVLLTPNNFVIISGKRFERSSNEETKSVPLLHGDTIQVGKDVFKLEYVNLTSDNLKKVNAHRSTGSSEGRGQDTRGATSAEMRARRHPDHPGSPVQIRAEVDVSHIIKPKAVKAQPNRVQMESTARSPIVIAAKLVQETSNPHDFGNNFVTVPRAVRHQASTTQDKNVGPETAARKSHYSGNKFRGEPMLNRGERNKPKPKSRDHFQEQARHLKMDDAHIPKENLISSATDEDFSFVMSDYQRQLLESKEDSLIVGRGSAYNEAESSKGDPRQQNHLRADTSFGATIHQLVSRHRIGEKPDEGLRRPTLDTGKRLELDSSEEEEEEAGSVSQAEAIDSGYILTGISPERRVRHSSFPASPDFLPQIEYPIRPDSSDVNRRRYSEIEPQRQRQQNARERLGSSGDVAAVQRRRRSNEKSSPPAQKGRKASLNTTDTFPVIASSRGASRTAAVSFVSKNSPSKKFAKPGVSRKVPSPCEKTDEEEEDVYIEEVKYV